MQQSYAKALADTLVYEGGWSDQVADPGGATMKGVTIAVYRGYKGVQASKSDLRNISQADLEAIYRQLYADKIKFDDLPAGVDMAVFDAAVNSGPHQAAKWLQQALGIPVDGNIGPATIQAAHDYGNEDELVGLICDRRLAFCKHLRTWSTFGKGWAARIAQVRRNSQQLAPGDVGATASYALGGEKKALLADAKPLVSTAPADAVSGGGVVSATITQVTNALTPVSSLSDHIATAVTILTAAGGLMLAGGMAYRAYASSVNKDRTEALGLPTGVSPVAQAPEPAAA